MVAVKLDLLTPGTEVGLVAVNIDAMAACYKEDRDQADRDNKDDCRQSAASVGHK